MVVLPEPLSPTSPTVSPSRTVDANAVDRAHMADDAAQHAAADREMHFHVVRLASAVGGASFGSGGGPPRGTAASSMRV